MYDHLVNLFEDQSILTPRSTSCYSLSSIRRDVKSKKPRENQREITLTFTFTENFIRQSINGYSHGDMNATTESSCQSSRSQSYPSMQSMSMQRYDGNETDDDGRNKSTGISTKLARSHEGESAGGLSNTQKLVIATCSAVIGTFFIVAGVMRIRNCFKRMREEQMSRERSYRLPLHSADQNTPETNRRASVNSKTSLQQSPSRVVHDALYHQVSNGLPTSQNSPKVAYGDFNPVLVITAPSIQNTPSDSNASIRYIDDDSSEKGISAPVSPEEEISPLEQMALIDSKSGESVTGDNNQQQFNCSQDAEKAKHHVEITEPCLEQENLVGSPCNNDKTDLREKEDLVKNGHIDDTDPLQDEQQTNFSVNVGLTQSDESLESGNRSYCYGNQAEYSSDSGYGYVAYCPNGEPYSGEDNENDCLLSLQTTESNVNSSDDFESSPTYSESRHNSDDQNSPNGKSRDCNEQDVDSGRPRFPLTSIPSLVIDDEFCTNDDVV
ncbi:hypothetical protein FSP39_018583 [Pinctada imbricata]|uniref:Uncharacterized protein n=1 Tax=Pinctada imbricata TaxID=66713 RepID=A0AA88YTN8_PINIB|nr:hypothetical protein FSP39_018583 [Pinctada imbricata]